MRESNLRLVLDIEGQFQRSMTRPVNTKENGEAYVTLSSL